MKNINRFYPYLLAIIGFTIVSLIYFYPVLQGKKISQSDIAQYTGMAKERDDFRKNAGEESYWTDSAFGGMPTYQLGAHYPYNFIKAIDGAIRFLPRPADYLFLYFFGFFVLLKVLRINTLMAFFGSLAFGFSTYYIILFGAGHNAKAHAIAYMPMVIAGVLLVFRKRYIAGGLLTLLASALEINANHIQMTYYLFILLLIIGIYFIVEIIKNKEYKHLGISVAVFAGAALLAVGMNATNLMATAEYAKFSTRSDSQLTFNPDGSRKESANAMSYEYITEYSYGLGESLNLIAPRLYGGSSGREKLDKDSHVVEYLQTLQVGEGQYLTQEQAMEFAQNGIVTYWGDQTIVAAPAYIGAVVFFLFVLALFAEERKLKYAFLAGAIVSLLLSWGKHFPVLTNLFIDYVPMYNKFRAVASIQVVLELCIPVLAIMGFYAFFKTDKDKQWKYLWQSAAVCLGILLVVLGLKSQFDFAGPRDAMYAQQLGQGFIDALKEDRRDMYSSDIYRSAFFILAVAAVLWLYTKQKLAQTTTIILAGFLMVADLFLVDKNYVNTDSFVSAREADIPFTASPADEQILQDDAHYRVFDMDNHMNGAQASYFHNSIGGYHAAKPQKMQQIFDYQIAKSPMNIKVLDMLNVKYVLQRNEQGQVIPIVNNTANGNAWFVSTIKAVSTPDEEMKALDKLDTKTEAVVNKTKFAEAATKTSFAVDSTATIKLDEYRPNKLSYTSQNKNDGFAVFSEAYYAKGWNAYIDGKLVPHYEADYMLRALKVPAGKHTIIFAFEPEVVKTGSTIALISFIVMLGLLGAGVYFENKRVKTQVSPKI
ncbi:YfhO family protein [Flavobacterium sp. Sd200]|uniref:YfhO family protein n=1 Tax=Flavobacterium sp. Sd200 TaxID=2692211 RepID=UPI0013703E47|nr:YfhO family protein [Flavobacterium sp. Sd200]MXN92415.1 YfhO family protein [Flavobacterium sp. Sd200]